MSRNWFDAYCEKHNEDFKVLIGNPTECPLCVRERLATIEGEGVTIEDRNAVIIKPGGEKEG